jgi:hypothetical protein
MDAILKLIDNAGWLLIAAYFLLTAVWSILTVILEYRNLKNDTVVSNRATYTPRIRPLNKAQLKIIRNMPRPGVTEKDGIARIAV